MRIGIDYTPAALQGGGIGRYVRELVRALATVDHENQYTLFMARGRVSTRDVWGGERALMVSDGGELEGQVKGALERAGYQVEACGSRQAMEALERTNPDLVVTPRPTDHDATELTKALRAACAERGIHLLLALVRGRRLVLSVPNFRFKSATVSDVWLARLWHRLHLPVPIETLVGAQELFHATDFVLPPTYARTRTLLTVHDLSFIRDPDSATPALRRYLNAVVPRSVARAHHVLADSLATKEDLVELYGTAPDKITVLYSGVGARFTPEKQRGEEERVRRRYKLGHQPFILSLGTLQPRKNYGRLIAAFARVADVSRWIDGRPASHNLVIVGKQGWLFDSIKADVARLGVRTRVIFPGYVDDQDLPALYRAADMFVFPSLYEGFGLPPLEAMACGTPVVTSNVSSLPEVVGDAGLTVDPTDIYALADTMGRALQDSRLRQGMIERGLARAAEFTWLRAARQLLQVYRQVGGHNALVEKVAGGK
jgi:glycosyltransferase involved in cell wall biosynthesis